MPVSRSGRTGLGLAAVALAMGLLASCKVPVNSIGSTDSTAAVAGGGSGGALAADDPNSPVAAPGTCHMGTDGGQPLPDPHCTPGAVNPQVTQANISSTICHSGYTATIRPAASVTDKLKREQISAYADTDTRSRDYEEDHLVSLELGGAPDDPRNLWPEPGASPNPKDKVENALNKAVCSGRVQLAAAQAAIASDWTTAEAHLGIG